MFMFKIYLKVLIMLLMFDPNIQHKALVAI